MNILITGAGGPAGQALIGQLSDTEHRVIGVETQPAASSHPSVLEQLPPASDPEMMSALLGVIDKYGVKLVIPTVSAELPVIADARASGLFRDVRVVIGEQGPVRTAHDRYLTMQCLERANVSVPDYGLPSSYRDAESVFDFLGEEIVVKPRFSPVLHRTRRVSRGQEDLTQLDDSLFLQSYAPGASFAPMLYLPCSDEEPSVQLVEKIRPGPGRPSVSLVRLQVAARDRDIINTAVAAANALRLTGPVNVDIRRAANGIPQVLKVTARVSANCVLAPGLIDSVLREFSPPTGLLVDQMDGVR